MKGRWFNPGVLLGSSSTIVIIILGYFLIIFYFIYKWVLKNGLCSQVAVINRWLMTQGCCTIVLIILQSRSVFSPQSKKRKHVPDSPGSSALYNRNGLIPNIKQEPANGNYLSIYWYNLFCFVKGTSLQIYFRKKIFRTTGKKSP